MKRENDKENNAMTITNPRKSLTPALRTALKTAIANSTEGRKYMSEVGKTSVSDLLTHQLYEAADRADIVVADIEKTLSRTASQAFAGQDLSGEPEDNAATVEPTRTTKRALVEVRPTLKAVQTAFLEGPEELARVVGDLVQAANRVELVTVEVEVEKVVTVEKEVEKVVTVERLVEVPAPPPGCRPAHMPQVVGTVELCGVTGLPKYDAPDAPRVDPLYRWPKSTGIALTKVKRSQAVFVWGPAGTGKTSFAQQLAAHCGRPFVRISFHQDTSAASIVGGYIQDGAGGFRWQDGVLLKAMRRPGTVVLLDEISAARPDAAMVLQGPLEGAGLTVDETGEYVRVAPGVVWILADNTNGTGDQSGQYDGTKRMNRATLDRPAVCLHLDYLDEDQEIGVLVDRTGIDQARATRLVAFANLTRTAVDKGTLTGGVSLRRLLSWAECIVDGVGVFSAFEAAVVTGAPHDDTLTLVALFKTVWGPDQV